MTAMPPPAPARRGLSLTRGLLLFGLVAFLPAAAVVLYLESELRAAREAEVLDSVGNQTANVAAEMARFVDGTRLLLTAIAAAPAVRKLEESECAAFVGSVAAEVESVRGIGIIDLTGAPRCRQQPDQPAFNLADRPYFQEVIASGSFVIGTFTPSRTEEGRSALPLAMPVRDLSGVITAVAVAAVDTRQFARLVDERIIEPGGIVTIADRNGIVISRLPDPGGFVGNALPEEGMARLRRPTGGTERFLAPDGSRRIRSYKPTALAPAGLYVGSSLSEAEAFAAIDQARRRSVAIILAGAALALGGAWWAGRVFVRRPVAELLARAESWRLGRPERPRRIPEGREFAEIAMALDRMGGELEEREAAARGSEARLRRTIEAAPHPFMLHAEDGEILELSASWTVLSGYSRTALPSAKAWAAAALPDAPADDPVVHPFDSRDHAGGLERVILGGDGRERVWDFSIVPLEPLADGRRLCLTAAVDVTERYRAAEQQDLLLRELDHRVKNTLAVVQAIASQTFRSIPDPAEFVQRFSERLGALARTHDMLTKGQWRGVSLRGLAEAELAHVPVAERIAIVGVDVTLPVEMAVPLGLILHELATNAIKYGALSAPEGRLTLGWTRLSDADGAERIDLTWREEGGPAPAPAKPGFGSKLIGQLSRAIGEARSDYRPTGLDFHLLLPLPAAGSEPASAWAGPRPSERAARMPKGA